MHHSKTDRTLVPERRLPNRTEASANFCDDVSDGDYDKYYGNDDYDDGDVECGDTHRHSNEGQHFMC